MECKTIELATDALIGNTIRESRILQDTTVSNLVITCYLRDRRLETEINPDLTAQAGVDSRALGRHRDDDVLGHSCCDSHYSVVCLLSHL